MLDLRCSDLLQAVWIIRFPHYGNATIHSLISNSPTTRLLLSIDRPIDSNQLPRLLLLLQLLLPATGSVDRSVSYALPVPCSYATLCCDTTRLLRMRCTGTVYYHLLYITASSTTSTKPTAKRSKLIDQQLLAGLLRRLARCAVE